MRGAWGELDIGVRAGARTGEPATQQRPGRGPRVAKKISPSGASRGPGPGSGPAFQLPPFLVGHSGGFDPPAPESPAGRGSDLGLATAGVAAARGHPAAGLSGRRRQPCAWGANPCLGGDCQGAPGSSRGFCRAPPAPGGAAAERRPLEAGASGGAVSGRAQAPGIARASPRVLGQAAALPRPGQRVAPAGAGAPDPGQATSATRRPNPAHAGRSKAGKRSGAQRRSQPLRPPAGGPKAC